MRTAPVALALAAATAAALVFTAAATAGRNAYTVRMTAEGQAAARAALLTKADLGPGWEGGQRKPQLSAGLSCPHFHPKFSDLVIVGAASVQYHQPGLQMRSDSQVFRTEKMVSTDWRRTAQRPRFLRCLRAVAKRSATSGKSRFVSFRKLRVPVIGTRAVAFRTIFDVRSPQGTIRLAVDIIGFTQGRTELTLTTTMALASAATLAQNELVLAKSLVSRVRA